VGLLKDRNYKLNGTVINTDVQSTRSCVSHTMNTANKSLEQRIQRLTTQVGGLRSRRPQRQKKRLGRVRGLARNPGSRGNMPLSLTRSQFTATSPLNLFDVGVGSTPGGIRVSGRELVSAVTIPVTTGVYTLSSAFNTNLNFGAINPNSFPRLVAYAPIYEYFVFHRLTYFFQSNQPTTSTGAVILSIEYDSTDPVPASTTAQMRNISSTMANIFSDCSLQGTKSLSRLDRFKTDTPTATNLIQANQGVLYVATEGFIAAAATTVGYIIAQYDLEFYTPQ